MDTMDTSPTENDNSSNNHNNIDNTAQTISEPSVLFIDHDRNERLRITIKDLVREFEEIPLQILTEEEKTCPCCQVEYGKPENEDDQNSIEFPVRTQCGHYFGENCMKEWLHNNTCPLCRAKLFPWEVVRVPERSARERLQAHTGADIADLEAEIARLDGRWARLEAERARLEAEEAIIEAFETRINEHMTDVAARNGRRVEHPREQHVRELSRARDIFTRFTDELRGMGEERHATNLRRLTAVIDNINRSIDAASARL